MYFRKGDVIMMSVKNSLDSGEENIMLKKWKKLLAFCTAVIIGFSLTACQGQDKQQVSTKDKKSDAYGSTSGGAKGRFIENPLSLPEGYVNAFRVLDGGSLRMVTDAGIYDSADEGETWSIWDKQPQEFSDDIAGEMGGMGSAVIGGDGSVYYTKEGLKRIDKDGNWKELNTDVLNNEEEDPYDSASSMIGSTLSLTCALQNGDVIGYDQSGTLFLVSGSDDSIRYIQEKREDNGNASTYVVSLGEKLYVMLFYYEEGESDGIAYKDCRVLMYGPDYTGDGEDNEVLSEFLAGGAGMEGAGDVGIFFTDQNQKAIYIANSSGVYRYLDGGTVVEKIFDGAMGQMSSSFCIMGAAQDENNFYIYYLGQEADTLVKYTYDPEAAAVPDKEITVYSLYENQEIRQAVTRFQRENPNVYVKVETGITGTDGMTVSDALKTLNTNIMAGEGPDVLALEGMPVDSYMEKGMLADISDVIDEVSEEDGLFENITSAYEKDGRILAVPVRFAVPVIMGNKESLNTITDLSSFADKVEQQRAEHPEKPFILGNLPSYILLKTCYPWISPTIWNQDNTLNEDRLRAFFSDMKRIGDANGSGMQEEASSDTGEDSETEPLEQGMAFDLAQFMTTAEFYTNEMGFTQAEAEVSNLKTVSGLFKMTSLMKQLGNSDYALAPGKTKTYIPINSVGVNAKSEEMDIAKGLVKELIGKEQGGSSGWPVNKKAFETIIQKPANLREGDLDIINETDGTTTRFTWVWPEKEEFEEFAALVGTLDTPVITDETVNKTILYAGSQFVRGEISLEDAVRKVMDKLDLYLSE